MAEFRHTSGGAELAKRLRELAPELKRTTLKYAVSESAKVVRDEARQNFRTKWQEITGRLYRNIVTKFIPEKSKGERVTFFVLVRKITRRQAKSAKITGSAFYWRFLEFGTAFIRAQPFMRPALKDKSQQAIDTMGDKLRQGLKTIWEKGKPK